MFFRESCFRQSGDKARKNNPTHYRCAAPAVLCCASTLPAGRLLSARARHIDAGWPSGMQQPNSCPDPVGWHAHPLLTRPGCTCLHYSLQQPEGVLPNLRQRARSAGEKGRGRRQS